MGTEPFAVPRDRIETVLTDGDMEIQGRMPWSSNATLLVTMELDGDSQDAIYKPHKGERPLWDFPDGLYRREVAMFRLSEQLGWSVVPPTVLGSGEFGEGSIQARVDTDYSEHYFTLMEHGRGIDDLQRICVLDLLANSTDRKSGHCLLGTDDHVYAIDNGLSFHAEWKLRTVMWDFVGEPIPDCIIEAVRRFAQDGPGTELCALLDPAEQRALVRRAEVVVAEGVFPGDDTGGHRWPWPLV